MYRVKSKAILILALPLINFVASGKSLCLNFSTCKMGIIILHLRVEMHLLIFMRHADSTLMSTLEKAMKKLIILYSLQALDGMW